MAETLLKLRIRKAWWVGPLFVAGWVWCWLRLPINMEAFSALYMRGHRVEAERP